ncbi:MAG: polyhydroxybutyrate depolymerase [Parcubacteria group bacterium Gr01-1014_33]|nr:MAG: polyhydroxybutyrate depolymerase [Parcubacteria group bacterium Gr01-1014_33]
MSSFVTPGDYRESLVVDGRTRTYLLHVPSGYTGTVPLPLILAFHGYGGNGERMADVTQLSPFADTEHFIVVYPDGFEKSWNHGDGNRPAVAANIADAKFVRTLIGELEKKLAIDKEKIFAAGFSNGALMTQRLGCELADVLAGIAPVSGSLPQTLASSCKPAKPISFHLIYGIVDPLSPYNGGALKSDGGSVLSAKDTLAFWAGVNGCSAPKDEILPLAVNDGTAVIQTTYQCEKADTVLYAIEGGGHAWPPHEGAFSRIAGKSSKNIDATKVIWEFFKAHPRK